MGYCTFLNKKEKEPTEIYKLLKKENIEFVETGGEWYDIFLPLKKASGLDGLLGKKVPAKTLVDDIAPKICGMGNKVEYKGNMAVFTTPDGESVTAVINVRGYKAY